MNSCRLSLRAALLATLLLPACGGDKGDGDETTGSSTGGGTETSLDAATSTSGAVLTSTNGSSTEPVVTTSGSEGSTEPVGSSSSGEVSTGTTGEPEISCVDEPLYFPSFDRVCAEVADCSLVFHQTDCCGSLLAWGISSDVAKTFAEAEAVCLAQYPLCECEAMKPIADDGKSGEPNLIEVDCIAGECKTFVP